MTSFTSERQRVSFWKGALVAVMVVAFFAAPLALFLSLLVWMKPVVLPSVVFCSVGLFAMIVYWRLYRRSYDIKEEPVVERAADHDDRPWDTFDWACGRNELGCRVALYEQEFFLNALVNPRSVFSRIDESIAPGRRMLDCDVLFEVKAPSHHGVAVRGIQDLEVAKSTAKHAAVCELIVPVAFQRRGELTISQRVFSDSGTLLPMVKQSDITDAFVDMIDRYMAARGTKGLSSFARGSLREYLSSTRCNEDYQVPELVCSEMLSATGGEGVDKVFCKDVLKALVGLKDVIPVCVSMSVAALDEASLRDGCAARGHAPIEFPRIFKLRMAEKREMLVKPFNAVPNCGGSVIASVLNRILRRFAHRMDTVYYNIGNAARSTSYHLRVEGPENTYYARGSLIRENTEDRREIYAEQVEMQKRCGQRNAHLYIRSGHRMANTAFMFRFRKAPLDSCHIMFVAALLCLAVLSVCLMGSLGSLGLAWGTANPRDGGSVGFSSVSMLLAVVSAAGSWIYNRAWDGREDSLAIMASVFATVGCSVLGMLLSGVVFAKLVNKYSAEAPIILALWSIVISCMICVTVMMAYSALQHGSIYRYLLSKDPNAHRTNRVRRPRSKGIWVLLSHDDEVIYDDTIGTEVVDGVRRDTPQGRYVENDYCLWIRSLREYERSYGVNV